MTRYRSVQSILTAWIAKDGTSANTAGGPTINKSMVLPVSYHVDWLTIPACQWYGHIEIVFCQMICLAQVERLYETLIKQPEVQQSPKRASAIKTTEYEGVSNVGRRHLTSIAYSESGESCLRLCLLWSIRRGSLRFAECIMAQMQVHNLRFDQYDCRFTETSHVVTNL